MFPLTKCRDSKMRISGQDRTKPHFPKIRTKVTQRIVRHFVSTQTVLYDIMTQRDGTVRRLHQMLLKLSRESDLRRRLAARKAYRNFTEPRDPKSPPALYSKYRLTLCPKDREISQNEANQRSCDVTQHLIQRSRNFIGPIVSQPSKCLKFMTFREGYFVIRN